MYCCISFLKYIHIRTIFNMILYDNSIPQFGTNISECVLSRSLNIFGNIPLLCLYISTIVTYLFI